MKWGILATGTMTLEVEGKEPEVIRCRGKRRLECDRFSGRGRAENF